MEVKGEEEEEQEEEEEEGEGRSRRMVGIFISDIYSLDKTTKTVTYNFIHNLNFQVSFQYKSEQACSWVTNVGNNIKSKPS